MEVTNITKISMGEVASLAAEDEDERYYGWWQNAMSKVQRAIEAELQQQMDKAEDVYLNGVKLCDVDQVSMSNSDEDNGGLLLTLTFRNRATAEIAEWSIEPGAGASIKITSHGHGAIFITYGKE